MHVIIYLAEDKAEFLQTNEININGMHCVENNSIQMSYMYEMIHSDTFLVCILMLRFSSDCFHYQNQHTEYDTSNNNHDEC